MCISISIALVHHHILPLPARPTEWDSGLAAKVERAIFDEGFKLCENAGLLTDFMLRARIHLVLHGHQHQTFAANVRHLDHAAAPGHLLAVVGGPAARDGFEVVRFETLGDVALDRYAIGAGATFILTGSYPLWTYEEWKRAEWEKERRRLGWYRRSDYRSRLDSTGDLTSSRGVAGIYGGDATPIREVPIRIEVDNKDVAIAALTEVRDKLKDTAYPRSGLPAPSHKVEFTVQLDPPATVDKPHPGFYYKRLSKNAFALTAEEAGLVQTKQHQNAAVPAEQIQYGNSPCPIQRFTVFLQFPSGYVPQQFAVVAKDKNDAVDEPRQHWRTINWFSTGKLAWPCWRSTIICRFTRMNLGGICPLWI